MLRLLYLVEPNGFFMAVIDPFASVVLKHRHDQEQRCFPADSHAVAVSENAEHAPPGTWRNKRAVLKSCASRGGGDF